MRQHGPSTREASYHVGPRCQNRIIRQEPDRKLETRRGRERPDHGDRDSRDGRAWGSTRVRSGQQRGRNNPPAEASKGVPRPQSGCPRNGGGDWEDMPRGAGVRGGTRARWPARVSLRGSSCSGPNARGAAWPLAGAGYPPRGRLNSGDLEDPAKNRRLRTRKVSREVFLLPSLERTVQARIQRLLLSLLPEERCQIQRLPQRVLVIAAANRKAPTKQPTSWVPLRTNTGWLVADPSG